ncbi:glycerophosphodiester phosphodiesterase [Streptomyces sp. NPDC060194]|uniref:glycerophosphodiester phosphodiesterase n=1 Tax=Streptomyces sp. NPDC060194 TaxID=3347069 RepID=UPI0036471DF4
MRAAPPTARRLVLAALVAACALVLSSAHAVGPVPVPLRADAAALPPVVIAHRGASASAPENTLDAVDAAARAGVEWVENDVQRTRDGVLVVVHDRTLARTTDVEQVYPGRAPWRVGDLTAAEIARLDAGSWFGPRFAGVRVPTLAQYLGRVERNGQKLLLEIKLPDAHPGIARDTLRVLAAAGWLDRARAAHRLVVQSFDADTLRAVHALRPDVRTAFLGAPPVGELPAYAGFTDGVNPGRRTLTAAYVRAVQTVRGRRGEPLRVFAWTVDTHGEARRVAGYGVDGIITNRPDVVRDALEG